jgi:hypothetical protein
MSTTTWTERAEVEYDELFERCRKILLFTGTLEFDALDSHMRGLILYQRDYMLLYAGTLLARLRHAGVPRFVTDATAVKH